MKWIKVEDGLPDSENYLLLRVVDIKKLNPKFAVGWYDESGFASPNYSRKFEDVTHWAEIEGPEDD